MDDMDDAVRDGAVLLDDGEFYIELNANYPTPDAPGFLQRRCYVGVTTPGGYECVGSFDRCPSTGAWLASIDALYDAATDSDARVVGIYSRRLDAVVGLWAARRLARCRHRE
jgi:hypothetical protein